MSANVAFHFSLNPFSKAVAMLRKVGVALKSMRLDKYFSTRKVIRIFDRSVSLFFIPKKNIARIGVWADILGRMMASPVDFLSEYFHRNVCESGFSADKGKVWQNYQAEKRRQATDCAFLKRFFHNLYVIRINPK
jgi:transposase